MIQSQNVSTKLLKGFGIVITKRSNSPNDIVSKNSLKLQKIWFAVPIFKDAVYRSVAVIEDYHNYLIKDEQQLQYLLQVVCNVVY